MSNREQNTYKRVAHSALGQLTVLGDSQAPGAEVLPEMVAPWSLLQRARSLLHAIVWLLEGPSDAAVRIVARSLVDLAITVAWLRLRPEVHVRLYAAEQWRREMELLPELERRMGARNDEESHRVFEWKRTVVQQARTLALDNRVAGVRRTGPLVPSLRVRAETVGTAMWDAYTLMFAHWSEWGHTGSGSLSVSSDDTTVRFDDGPPKDDPVFIALVAAVYAFLLAEFSRWIGLGIEAECDAIREALVRVDRQTATHAHRTS